MAYEFQKAYNEGDFAKVTRLSVEIKSYPQRFFDGVRARGTVNQLDHDEMAERFFVLNDIEL